MAKRVEAACEEKSAPAKMESFANGDVVPIPSRLFVLSQKKFESEPSAAGVPAVDVQNETYPAVSTEEVATDPPPAPPDGHELRQSVPMQKRSAETTVDDA
jgi:hypothetical protein